MSKGKPGIMLYFDRVLPLLSLISREQAGELLYAALNYGKDGTMPSFPDSPLSAVWSVLKVDIDRDSERYNETVRKRSYAAYCREQKRQGKDIVDYDDYQMISHDVTCNQMTNLMSHDIKCDHMTSHDISRYHPISKTSTDNDRYQPITEKSDDISRFESPEDDSDGASHDIKCNHMISQSSHDVMCYHRYQNHPTTTATALSTTTPTSTYKGGRQSSMSQVADEDEPDYKEMESDGVSEREANDNPYVAEAGAADYDENELPF